MWHARLALQVFPVRDTAVLFQGVQGILHREVSVRTGSVDQRRGRRKSLVVKEMQRKDQFRQELPDGLLH